MLRNREVAEYIPDGRFGRKITCRVRFIANVELMSQKKKEK